MWALLWFPEQQTRASCPFGSFPSLPPCSGSSEHCPGRPPAHLLPPDCPSLPERLRILAEVGGILDHPRG